MPGNKRDVGRTYYSFYYERFPDFVCVRKRKYEMTLHSSLNIWINKVVKGQSISILDSKIYNIKFPSVSQLLRN